MERVPRDKNHQESSHSHIAQGQFAPKTMQGGIAARIDNSPHMVAQRQKLTSLFGSAAQLQGAEEETSLLSVFSGNDLRTHRDGASEVVQGVFTRSMLSAWVATFQGSDPVDWTTFNKLENLDKYMILDAIGSELFKAKGGDETWASSFFTDASNQAEENSDIDHEGGGANEITPLMEAYNELAQMKRGPGISAAKTIPSAGFTNVKYKRDGDGNIDFTTPEIGYTAWKNPVNGSDVNLEEDSKKKGYGKMLSGNFVNISDASRPQHFSIANRVAKKHGQTAGDGGASPPGQTWHHKLAKYKMHLVRTDVHSKFGHNGGFYFW